jgi:hypothetical protein
MAQESSPAISAPAFAVPEMALSAIFPKVFPAEAAESARFTVRERVAVFEAAESHLEPTTPSATWVAKLERSSACFSAGSFPKATHFSFQYSTAQRRTDRSP